MSQKTTRICKVCGKEYPYCHTITNDTFRWQDVACCPEHAAEYFERVAIARGEKPANASKKTHSKKEEVKEVIMAEPIVEPESEPEEPLVNKKKILRSKGVE